MSTRFVSAITATLLLTTAFAAGADPSSRNPLARDRAADPDPAVLFEVPGVGDGAITQADVDAVCAFTVWGFNLLLADAGETLRLDASANPRIVGFFAEAWPYLGADVQAFVANASQAAPAARASASGTDADETIDVFLEFSDAVWPGAEDATVAYFAGQLDDATYGAAWAAAQGLTASPQGDTGDANGAETFEDMASRFGYTPPPVQYEGDVIVNPSSGDVLSGGE